MATTSQSFLPLLLFRQLTSAAAASAGLAQPVTRLALYSVAGVKEEEEEKVSSLF